MSLHPLVEEVGLKHAWLVQMGAVRVPADLAYMRREMAKWFDGFRGERYETTVKLYANEALKIYRAMLSWSKIPKGRELSQYYLPPAVRKLHEQLVKQKVGK